MHDLFMVLVDKCFFIDTIFLQHCNTSFCMKRLLLHWWDSGSLVYGQEWNGSTEPGICFVAVLGKKKDWSAICLDQFLLNNNLWILHVHVLRAVWSQMCIKCSQFILSQSCPMVSINNYHSIFTLNISCFNLHVSVDFTSHKFRFYILNTCVHK